MGCRKNAMYARDECIGAVLRTSHGESLSNQRKALQFSRLSNSFLFFSSNARVLFYHPIEMGCCGGHIVRTRSGKGVTES